MTKLDDLGGRAAAQLRAAVADHLEAHPAAIPRKPRVPRAAAALGVVVAVALGASLLVNAQRDETSLQTADTSERAEGRAEVGEGAGDDPSLRVEDGSSASPGDDPAEAAPPSGGGTQSGMSPPLPGQSPPPPSGPGGEPPSTEYWPATCDTNISPGEVNDYPEWCVDGRNAEPQAEGHPLFVTVCRETRAGDGILHFPRRQEADFMITERGGQEVWRWSKTRSAVAQRHERPVRGGGCVTWDVIWPETDQSGRKVPKGTYRLSVTVLSDEIKGRWTLTYQEVYAGGFGQTTTTR